jgi:hypothetical protein
MKAVELLSANDSQETSNQRFNWTMWGLKWSAILLGTAFVLAAPFAIPTIIQERRQRRS